MKNVPVRLADLRGIHRLGTDATVGITDLVEAMHATILQSPAFLRRRSDGRTRGITGSVYSCVRGVTRLVRRTGDALFDALGRHVDDAHSSPEREAVLAALNGLFGDYLTDSGNTLAITMAMRTNGISLALSRQALAQAFPLPAPKLLVLVHGLCMNDLQWMRNGHDHGAALATDLGYTPVYLHYNTGRHISVNGRDFSVAMERLVREWPYPIEQLTMLGHSMGGLVIRSACHYAALARHTWPDRLDRLVFLGTPHLGAPLERVGALADCLMQISPYSAPFARLGMLRSAGIQDLGHGHLRDEDWQAKDRGADRGGTAPLPLSYGVRCYAIAASRQERPGPARGRIRGDGLVPVRSALGRSADGVRERGLRDDRCWIGYGLNHFDLLDRAQAYPTIRNWLDDDRRPRGSGRR
jgi:pimeloyl-ACP methyl ester carboxylesterase